VLLLLLRQSGELGAQVVIARQKRLLPMQDRWVGTGGVIEAIDLAGPERELDAAEQGRVRVGLEIGINEIRNLARLPVQLDQVGPVERSQVSPGTSLVNSQERVERLERRAMDVERGRQQLADGRPPAGLVDGLGAPGPEEQIIGQTAGVGVAAEERADVALEADRKCRDRRTAAESSEGQIHKQVFGAAAGDRVPLIWPCDALYQGEGSLERSESGLELRGLWELVRFRQPPESRDACHQRLEHLAVFLAPWFGIQLRRVATARLIEYIGPIMTTPSSARSATSSTPEDLFAELFTQVFGIENTRLLVPEFPVEDIYGGSRYVDFALKTIDERVAFEIDGLMWHVPDAARITEYEDSLLRQNSLIHQG
jgi:hypothetical protein